MTDDYVNHVGYMLMQAEQGSFKTKAHIGYDRYVRETAETIGWEAFTAGNVNATLQYYSLANLTQSLAQASNKGKASKNSSKVFRNNNNKKACQGWNFGDGCTSGASCNLFHSCSHCWSTDHAAKSCPNPEEKKHKLSRR